MEFKKRIVALDVGDKRIGIAVSDAFGWTAQGIESYVRINPERDFEHILEILKNYEPLTLLIGLPLNMNGTFGFQAKKTQEFVISFCEYINGKLDYNLEYFDERMTSVDAEKILLEADMSRAKRRRKIDMLAAMQILQSYMTMKN